MTFDAIVINAFLPFTNDTAYAAKLDSSGNAVWATAFGNGYDVQLVGVTTDGTNCYATGTFKAPFTFGSTTLTPVGSRGKRVDRARGKMLTTLDSSR